MRTRLFIGFILVTSLLGIVLFGIGTVFIRETDKENKILGYQKNKCQVYNHIIGRLNICDTGKSYETFYMAVWNVSYGNITNIATVLLPDSRYQGKELAERDVKNGPRYGNISDCMCPVTVTIYPQLNDDNNIDCDVWKACLLEVDAIKMIQSDIRNRRNAGVAFMYIGLCLETLLVVIGILCCLRGRED